MTKSRTGDQIEQALRETPGDVVYYIVTDVGDIEASHALFRRVWEPGSDRSEHADHTLVGWRGGVTEVGADTNSWAVLFESHELGLAIITKAEADALVMAARAAASPQAWFRIAQRVVDRTTQSQKCQVT